MSTPRIYVAGPMTGKPHFNFAAFYEAEAQLIDAGWRVDNPARIDIETDRVAVGETGFELTEKFDLARVLLEDLELIRNADAVYFLREWGESKGAQLEYAYAVALGKAMYYQNDNIATPTADEWAEDMADLPVLKPTSPRPGSEPWKPFTGIPPLPKTVYPHSADAGPVVPGITSSNIDFGSHTTHGYGTYFPGVTGIVGTPGPHLDGAMHPQVATSGIGYDADPDAPSQPLADLIREVRRTHPAAFHIQTDSDDTPQTVAAKVANALRGDEEVRVTSETGGQKGKKLAQLGALDPVALLELAKVAGMGAEKYATFNFLKGYDWSLSFNAALRHLLEFWDGHDIDPESGLSAAAHAAWQCLALVSFWSRQIGTDDRPPRHDD